MNAQAQTLANKLNRKRETIMKLRGKRGFYRVNAQWEDGEYDFLTARGRKLIDDAYFLINDFLEIDADDRFAAWDWYCKTYNDGVWFDADDLAA